MEHPKGLYFISSVETLTTFSFYGVRILLSLYMILVLFFTKDLTSNIYGVFSGLIYLTPLIGGYVCDNYLGNHKSITLGMALLTVSMFILAASASLYVGPLQEHGWFIFSTQEILFLIGLTIMIIGNGFFKPNNASMIKNLYVSKEDKLNAAFTLFYTILNFGGLFAPLIIGSIVGETPEYFKIGFLISAIVMLITLIIFILIKNRYLIDDQGKVFGKVPNVLIDKKVSDDELDYELMKKYGYQEVDLTSDSEKSIKIKNKLNKLSKEEKEEILTGKLTKIEKDRILALFITIFFGIFFFTIFEQIGISLTFFIQEHIMFNLGTITIQPEVFQTLNPLFIVIFAPISLAIFEYFEKRGLYIPIAIKTGIGLIILSAGFLILCIPGALIDFGIDKVHLLWIVFIYFIISVSELTFIPHSQSLVTILSPKKFISLMMGAWFVSYAVSCFLAGILSSFYPNPSDETIPMLFNIIPIVGFTDFFLMFGIIAAIGGIAVFFLNKPLKKWMHWKNV